MKQNKRGEALSVADAGKGIMDRLGGYHRCFLGGPIYLEFVSQNFCSMLGYRKTEFSELVEGVYTVTVHADDVSTFVDFVQRMAKKETSESLSYRLIKKDGSIIRVADTMTSVVGNDGFMRGYSVVSEIHEGSNEAWACDQKIAILKVLGGNEAKIMQVSGAAFDFAANLEVTKRLSFLDFVSISDRARICGALKKAYSEWRSGADSYTLVSVDGSAHVCKVWVERIRDDGDFDSAVFCVKVQIENESLREEEHKVAFSRQLFSSFAEDLFEADRVQDTVTYIARSDSSLFDIPLNVRMFTDDITRYLLDRVAPESREAVKQFCIRVRSTQFCEGSIGTAKIGFLLRDRYGDYVPATATVVAVSERKYLMGLSLDSDSPHVEPSGALIVTQKQVIATLFGSFSLSVNGKAVNIRSAKAKELLALLIERRGAFVSSREAIAMLWECEPDQTTRARYRKTASRLVSELKRNGIEYIVESDRGARRVVPECLECDYYDYRDGLRAPSGALLPEYSWSEFILID